MRIGFDIDGVLADFNTDFIKLVPEVTGRNLFPPGYWPHTWDYPKALGYADEETRYPNGSVWKRIAAGDVFWRNLPALPDAKTLNRWFHSTEPIPVEECHEFYFITSRTGKLVKLQTEEWLDEHVAHGQTVLISSEKGAIAKALKLDFYIDDRGENILDVEKVSPNTRAFLLNQPWNTDFVVKQRCHDVAEFLSAIDHTHSITALPAVA